MNARRVSLSANWRNVILANYPVPERILRPLLPTGLDLDTREDACWASLVAFQFLDTRVLGVGWPGQRPFPQWNLRFYVREGERRGVCFVRQFVPRRLMATLARVVYHEPYRAVPMSMDASDGVDVVTASYSVRSGGDVDTLRAVGSKPAVRAGPDSSEHWFKEHRWGYRTSRRGKLIRSEVNHPEWDTYPVREFAADVNWALLYGPHWSHMNGVEPASVVLAAGSEAQVYPTA